MKKEDIGSRIDHLIRKAGEMPLCFEIDNLYAKTGVYSWEKYKALHDTDMSESEYREKYFPGTSEQPESEDSSGKRRRKTKEPDENKPESSATNSSPKVESEEFGSFVRNINHQIESLNKGRIPEADLTPVRGKFFQYALAQTKKATGYTGQHLLDTALEALHRSVWAEPVTEKSPGKQFNRHYISQTLLPHAYAAYRASHKGATLEEAQKDPKIAEMLKYVTPYIAKAAWDKKPNKALANPTKYKTQERKTIWDWKPGSGNWASYISKAFFRTAGEIRRENEGDEALAKGIRLSPAQDDYTPGSIDESNIRDERGHGNAESKLMKEDLIRAGTDADEKIGKTLRYILEGGKDFFSSGSDREFFMKELGMSGREFDRFKKNFVSALPAIFSKAGIDNMEDGLRVLQARAQRKSKLAVFSLRLAVAATQQDDWIAAIIS